MLEVKCVFSDLSSLRSGWCLTLKLLVKLTDRGMHRFAKSEKVWDCGTKAEDPTKLVVAWASHIVANIRKAGGQVVRVNASFGRRWDKSGSRQCCVAHDGAVV